METGGRAKAGGVNVYGDQAEEMADTVTRRMTCGMGLTCWGSEE